MPTATNRNITPTRRAALGFSAAAIVAGMTVPVLAKAAPTRFLTPIAALNQSIRAMAEEHHALDLASLEAVGGPASDAADDAMAAKLHEILALQDQVVRHQAETTEDAAIQATIGFYLVERMSGIDEDDAVERASLRTLLASIILYLGKAGNLDIDRLGWGDMGHLCALRAPGGECAA